MTLSPTHYAAVALVLSFAAFVPYVASILRRETQPHLLSWVIWTLLPAIAFVAQWTEGGGAGSWVVGCAALQSLVITVLALSYGERSITRSDIAAFAAGLSAIPLWLVTDNALLAVVTVTLIDILGFYPTMRKSWVRPYGEYLPTYVIVVVSFTFSILALDVRNMTTMFYPAGLILTNAAFVLAVSYRRRTYLHLPPT